jgi:hypothetical protein
MGGKSGVSHGGKDRDLRRFRTNSRGVCLESKVSKRQEGKKQCNELHNVHC